MCTTNAQCGLPGYTRCVNAFCACVRCYVLCCLYQPREVAVRVQFYLFMLPHAVPGNLGGGGIVLTLFVQSPELLCQGKLVINFLWPLLFLRTPASRTAWQMS